MKTKQMVGILVTGAVIIAVGVTGVVSNIVKSKFTQSKKSDVSSVVNNLMGEASVSLPTEDFIGVINIEGGRQRQMLGRQAQVTIMICT